MVIPSLPLEITLLIADFLDPYTCFDFSIICKSCWSLCAPLVAKHKQLFAENSIIDTTPAWGTLQPILWEKLNQYLDCPYDGFYVRDITLPSNRSTYLDVNAAHDFQLSRESPAPPQDDIKRYHLAMQMIEERHGQNDNLTSNWDSWIRKGSSEPILSLLIHYTPNLKIFRFTDLELKEVFLPLLYCIAMGYGNPRLAPNLPFQHLTTVAVAHWDTESSCASDWCQYFCSIPSVRSFVARAMGGSSSRHRDLDGLPSSNVRELVFQNSRFDASAIEQILKKTPLLERFTYDVGDASVAEEVFSVEPDRVLRALQNHVGHSLQHAVFASWADWDNEEELGDVGQVSLRDFKELKTLRCDWHILRPIRDEIASSPETLPDGDFYTEEQETLEDFDFRSILPASLEVLVISGSAHLDDTELLSELPKRSAFTPLLNKIYLPDEGTDILDITGNPLLQYLQGQG
ncbi:hypothetical protein DM02DRAFT_543496 [Periconia macrospinosa]|uniref:F-box domain-containing protein n=1 Tax=Periconia macrospinosa TaxID=97972 RepID=A0A2V1D4E4_9PLEO|nr:hypothetical protein DM02DRAFT_543496 [Periconia macrospinosa]